MISKVRPSILYLLSLLLSGVFAAPFDSSMEAKGLVKRVPGSDKSNPIDATVDITGWEDISEQDCYAMLCIWDGERVWQRGRDGQRSSNYIGSGASLKPFRKDELAQRHTQQINSQARSSTETNSAEKFPWESMMDGGKGAVVFPATSTQQRSQSGNISAAYRATGAIIPYENWFRITFTGNLGTMCTALMQTPPDKSVCINHSLNLFGKTGINLNNFVYYVSRAAGPYLFYHAAGTNKGKSVKRMSPIEERALQAKEYNFAETRAENADLDSEEDLQ